jgi:hypothetical protein
MNLNVTFNAPSIKRHDSFLMMKHINANLETLAKHFDDIECVEIKVYDTLEDNKYNNKAAFISVKYENEIYIKYQISGSWDKLVKDLFSSLIATIEIRDLDLLLID